MKKNKIIISVLNSILPVLLAFVVGAIIMLLIGANPIEAYSIMFGKSLFTFSGLMNTLHTAAPMIITGLAIAISFRANLYNMGVEGQFLLGGFIAGLIGAYLHFENPILHKFVCFLAGALIGAAFALIPAILRAYLKVDEMVVTLTLNYVVSIILEYLSSGPFRDPGAGYVATPIIAKTAMFNRILNTRLTFFFVVALVIFLLFWFFLKKTKVGYTIDAIGKNPEFSEAMGLRVRRKIILIMIASGALSGFAGAGHMMSQEFKYTLSFSGATGLGWDGMLVSLLGNHNPLGILIAALFYSALKTGADNVSLYTNIPKEIVAVIQALIILFLSIRFINEKFGLTKKLFKKEQLNESNI